MPFRSWNNLLMTEIAGKRVLITGAASGLGRLLAIGAAERGGRPVLLDIDQKGLEQTQTEITETTGQDCAIYPCDLSDLASINHATEKVIEDHGGVDVLINNAGSLPENPSWKPLMKR